MLRTEVRKGGRSRHEAHLVAIPDDYVNDSTGANRAGRKVEVASLDQPARSVAEG